MTHAQRRPSRRRQAPAASALDFEPVPRRRRHDGFTAERQVDFIRALAECGCVDAACKRVGISTSAAYKLRGAFDARSFRFAWDAALDHAIQRLSDAAYSRAIHGVATPVFYRGEQVGERRRYDERLTMFLLRYRDPVRYGAWMDTVRAQRRPDAAPAYLNRMLDQVAADGYDRDDGVPLSRPFVRYEGPRFISEEEQEQERQRVAEARDEAAQRAREAEWDREDEHWDEDGEADDADDDEADDDEADDDDAEDGDGEDGGDAIAGSDDADAGGPDGGDGAASDSDADVVSTSSTSAPPPASAAPRSASGGPGPRLTPSAAAASPPARGRAPPETHWPG